MKKKLFEEDGIELGIFDDSNYYVSSGKTTYHNKLDSAIREIARLRANEDGYDLNSWLTSYRKCIEYLVDCLEGRV